MSVSQERPHEKNGLEGFPPKEQREERGWGAADGRKTEARVTVSIYAARVSFTGGPQTSPPPTRLQQTVVKPDRRFGESGQSAAFCGGS